MRAGVCACVHVCLRAGVSACRCVCVRARVSALVCLRACVCSWDARGECRAARGGFFLCAKRSVSVLLWVPVAYGRGSELRWVMWGSYVTALLINHPFPFLLLVLIILSSSQRLK